MPWSTPTLRQVRVTVRDSLRASLPGADANVPNSLLRVMSDAMGALAHHCLQYIDWLAKQLLPDTAETEWLDRHGQIWLSNADGTTGRKLATLAYGTIEVTGNNGSIVPVASQLVSGVNAVGFETTAQITVGSLPTQASVRALDPGTIGNLSFGDSIAFVNPIPGVDHTATAAMDFVGGTDDETDDELRARVLERIQQPPMGGSSEDFVHWCLQVPGCTRAWCAPLEMGIGTVTVRFMMDDLRADNHGIPNDADVLAVSNYLDQKRPVAIKDFFCEAPIAHPINLRISGLVNDEASVRASIESALEEMFLERAIPGGTIYRSWVDEAIAGAIGEDHHELEYTTTTMSNPGELPILGSIIYE